MKKLLITVLVLTFVLPLASCGEREEGAGADIVCLGFAEYEWTKNIVGDCNGLEVSMLCDSGMDIHSYQPTASDLMRISSADLLIYVASPGFAGFDDEIADMAGEKLNLLEYFGIEAHDHSHCDEHCHEHTHDHSEDEHIWLSLSHAVLCCDLICDRLCELYPDNSDSYSKNCEAYKAELTALDDEYKRAVADSAGNVLVFADRYPFVHMANDYSLECKTAFSGCTSDSEASFDRIVYLIEAVNENESDYVIIIDGSDRRIADIVISSTDTKNQQILTLNSMQTTGADDAEQGISYISVMRDNLEVLKKALG